MGTHRVRKAVIPAAGLGTRFLPATKVVPKEMLPICGKPLIQFAVEEAVASGLETVILVLSRGKELVAEHFRQNANLENILLQRGKFQELNLIRGLSELAEVHTVWQEAPLGLADAIRCARPLVRDESFAVILPDALIDPANPCIRQLMNCYDRYSGCVLATREVNASEVERFGILDVVPQPDSELPGRVFRVTSLIERPKADFAPSCYGIFGRYILEPGIFECIDRTIPGFSGELQITDSLLLYSQHSPLYAFRFDGAHYDAGDRFGFMKASIDYGLRDPELSRQLREYFTGVDLKLPSLVS